MATTRDAIKDIWGERTPYVGDWPVRVDERTTDEPERWVQSTCMLCSNGCGMDVGVKDGRIVGVRGRAEDRTNRGRLGPKGLFGWEANHSDDRLTRPLVRSGGKLREASWDEAMDLVMRQSREVRDRFTAGAIGIYNTGQLFIEDYYTLAVIGKAGLGTPHMDGNTRLCTATAARAFIETFGADGQPGSYSDVDVCDTLLLVGHNVASQQTVLWMRILDRLAGPEPPKLVVIDPRTTETARKADVHLAPRVGTNVVVLNGLMNLMIRDGRVDRAFLDAHTVGFDELKEVVAHYPPERVEELAQVPSADLRRAAAILGTTPRLVSTVLQGVYQSNQASAAAVQVNNLNLLRGMIGRPGCGILQMNGQPTSQNTRECGCDGEMPGFRNWENAKHVQDLARVWNVDPDVIPHWATPTHAMQIFRYAEAGSIKFLWIIGTNPAVSLPDLPRIRKVLGKEGLFLVVQDAWMTETAEFADVVLPAAIWGERTGTFTNTDRTVHIALKAVEPPGEARADLDILLDYARRMDFRDKDGAPLIKWSDPEGAFEAWKECSRGCVCDYTGLSYAKLAGGSGIQWPCNDEHPDGTERLYTDLLFKTDPDECGDYGHDLITGAAIIEQEYRARSPGGRAVLKPAEYVPPFEQPDDDYPFWVMTGRVVYHWHTRTKTGRSKALRDAAPDAFVQINADDAARLGIADGDMVEVESRRGKVRAPARVGDIIAGHLFIPFHYGYWDGDDRPRAANELTLPEWDPVSKQPHFKYAAARVGKVTLLDRAGDLAGSVAEAIRGAAGVVKHAVSVASASASDSQVDDYLGLARAAEAVLADAFRRVGERHAAEPDMRPICNLFADWSRQNVEALAPLIARYSANEGRDEPERLNKALFHGERSGGLGLLRDLHDLWLLANEAHITWEVLKQAAQAMRDEEMIATCRRCTEQADRRIAWLRTRIDQAAPQAVVVPS
jgi:ferredoxin-nitrate reductase